SDLPPASGMSSSSAIITGTAMALADLNELPATEAWAGQIPDRVALAGYAASIENGKSFGTLRGRPGVGTSGGSLDHTGMLTSEEGRISYAEFDPMRIIDRVALPEGWSFVVGVSGVLAEKTCAAQEASNRRTALLSLLAVYLEAPLGAAVERLVLLRRRAAEGGARERLEQVLVESTHLVPRAHAALRSGDLDAFAAAVHTSQGLAETHLRNQ